jgi:hypothetical protein
MRSDRNVITACVSVTSLDSCDHIYRAGCSSTEPWFSGRPAHRRGLSRGMPLDALAKRVPVRAKRGAATAERSEGTILTRRAETSEAQALFMSSAAVAINFNSPAQKKSKGRVENIPRTKDQAARTHDLAPRAQDTEASPCHGTQCSGGNCGQGPSIFCPHREGGPPF